MKILNLKQMTIAAMLGTSLLLTGCGGGGGGGSVTPLTPIPITEPAINPDDQLGVLFGLDLTYGVTDTMSGSTRINNEVTKVHSILDDTFNFVASEIDVDGVTGESIRAQIEASTESDVHSLLDARVSKGQLTIDEAAALTDILIPIHRIVNNVQSTEDVYRNLNLSGVAEAHAEGWTGLGVNVAVIDGEFNSLSGHGFNVGLLAAAVAPGANITEHSYSDLSTAIVGQKVVTISVGSTSGSDDSSKVSALEGSEAVVTIAAQHSHSSASVCSAGGTVEACNTWSLGGLDSDNIIFVGEVGSDNLIPTWSNTAGDKHKNQFLVTRSNSLLEIDGTRGNSYAAPRVAGAAALVRHKFPGVSGSETALIILNTADNLGAAGVDDVYGHGLLNVGAALSPVGNLH